MDAMFAEIAETAVLENTGAAVSVTTVRKFRSTPHRVYAAWTEPRLLARWLVAEGETVTSIVSEGRKGGQFRLSAQHANGQSYILSGRFVDLAQDCRIVLSWFYEGPIEALRTKLSIVTAELRNIGDDLTECTVTHERIG
jgi:uncharacterized protein YndB with AHSA1/START domain